MEPRWLGERASHNINISAACEHAHRISAAVIVVVEHFVQLAPEEDSDTVAHKLLATAKGEHARTTHPVIIISDSRPLEEREGCESTKHRVTATPANCPFISAHHGTTQRTEREGGALLRCAIAESIR